ncbi:MAG: beta-ketoacyl-ACP synthase II [Chloroflexi bacterium]|nr:beta-ketoacyl-ACP synthase II [Chloroflexota bacterium]MCY3938949.1 beta-ketoacyl-ACP synthase II [Chloroflexota bacterium]
MAFDIAITGMGALTPLGAGVDSMWQGLLAGKSGIDRITIFDPSSFPCQIAGEVPDFDPAAAVGSRLARRTDRYVQFSIVAAKQALEDSGLEINDGLRDRVGVYIGSGIGGITTFYEQTLVLKDRGHRRVSPFLIPMMIPNMASGQVAIEVGATGPNMAHVSACASGAHAIGEAAQAIARGDAVAMVAGGSEAAITPVGLAGFCQGRALSTGSNDDPESASRPFDALRDGFVPSEGAGVLILEDMEFARSRGARIHARLTGYGASADAFHITAPPDDGAGAVQSMERALAAAGVAASDVDYINAHGTSTPLGDIAETAAVKRVFGNGAGSIPISSTKSMLGHLIGAAGSTEAIICVKALQDGVVPPTTNYENPDPKCDLDYVPGAARELRLETVLSNSFGFGGQNSSLIFRSA